jgi:hypothetical protein
MLLGPPGQRLSNTWQTLPSAPLGTGTLLLELGLRSRVRLG